MAREITLIPEAYLIKQNLKYYSYGWHSNLPKLDFNVWPLNCTWTWTLPEGFTAAWHGAHTPQQTHVFSSSVRAPETEILCDYNSIKMSTTKKKAYEWVEPKKRTKDLTRDRPSVIADIVAEGLPVVLVLRVMKRVKCYREPWRKILHHHLDLLVDQRPSGVDRENWHARLRHGWQSSVGKF